MNPLALAVVGYYLGQFLEEMTPAGAAKAMGTWHLPVAHVIGFSTPIAVLRPRPLPTATRFKTP